MTKTFDTDLFIDIIESVKGVVWIRDENKDGYTVRVFEGIIGKSVRIDTSEEVITEFVGRGLLNLLGLPHLGDSLFPPDKKD